MGIRDSAMIENIDFAKYKRFFAFGCSFTKFDYATWADIIGKEIPTYYNYGQTGGGNQFIFHSIIEANTKHKFDKSDLIIVMWTNIAREDRYLVNDWVTPGNIYTQDLYDKSFVSKFADTTGYLLRDLSFIEAARLIIENIKCDYDFLSMVPIDNPDQYNKVDNFNEHKNKEILDFYKQTLLSVKPSIQELLFPDYNWNKYECSYRYSPDKKIVFRDPHPVTKTYLEFLKIVYPKIKFSQTTLDYVESQMNIIKETIFGNGSVAINHNLERL